MSQSDKNGDGHSVCIKEWTAAYYVNANKKWVYGRLALISEGVVFSAATESKSGPINNTANYSLTIPFSSFVDVRKTTSTLIFPVVTISTQGDRHWFGSLSDRETVYNALIHFWRLRLIPTSKRPKSTTSTRAKTKLGSEMLNLALDSEKTLSNAATFLHHQGQQIDSSQATMDDLHNDLDVADRLVTGLESWLGIWHASSPVPLIDPVVINQKDLEEISNFDILYAKATGTSHSAFTPGSLWASRKEGITILGVKQEIVQHFGPGGICLSRIRVLNPWELTLTSYRVGEHDISFHIFSTKAMEALKHVQIGRENKVEYIRPSPTYIKVDREKLLSTPNVTAHGVSHPRVQQCASQPAGSTAISQTQVMQKSNPVSEQDVQDLSDILSNLKSMALAVQQEEDRQLENLDSLITSVDSANARREDLDKRVQKLLH